MREDALPRSRVAAYNEILDASGIEDHDFSEGIDVEQYGVTLEQSGDIEGDIFMAATMDPPVS
jgi:hypothetical protein